MKRILNEAGALEKVALALLAACPTLINAQDAATPAPLLLSQAVAATPWQATQRDFRSETWESAAPILDPVTGEVRVQHHKFLLLETGRNFLDENQQWQTTRDAFAIN